MRKTYDLYLCPGGPLGQGRSAGRNRWGNRSGGDRSGRAGNDCLAGSGLCGVEGDQQSGGGLDLSARHPGELPHRAGQG